MKKNSWREEPYWHWDWPGRPDQKLLGHAQVSNLSSDVDSRPQRPKSVLWIPDPEQQHGWREYYVYQDPMSEFGPPPQQRKLGFK